MNADVTKQVRAIIDKYAGLPFEYGTDCCTFAGDCVETLTGLNPMDRFSYRDETEAYRIIRSYGGLEGALRAVLGDPYDSHKDGDVCLIEAGEGLDAAAVIYRDRVVARTPKGLMDYPLSKAKMIWCT